MSEAPYRNNNIPTPSRTDARYLTTAFTLALTDANYFFQTDNASLISLTIPLNSNVPFKKDTEIFIQNIGAGSLKLLYPGITIHAKGNAIETQDDGLVLKKIDTDTWVALGNLTTL